MNSQLVGEQLLFLQPTGLPFGLDISQLPVWGGVCGRGVWGRGGAGKLVRRTRKMRVSLVMFPAKFNFL